MFSWISIPRNALIHLEIKEFVSTHYGQRCRSEKKYGTEESGRHGKCSTGKLRQIRVSLGWVLSDNFRVGQLPCRTTSVSENFRVGQLPASEQYFRASLHSSVLSHFKNYHLPGNLKFDNSGHFSKLETAYFNGQ